MKDRTDIYIDRGLVVLFWTFELNMIIKGLFWYWLNMYSFAFTDWLIGLIFYLGYVVWREDKK